MWGVEDNRQELSVIPLSSSAIRFCDVIVVLCNWIYVMLCSIVIGLAVMSLCSIIIRLSMMSLPSRVAAVSTTSVICFQCCLWSLGPWAGTLGGLTMSVIMLQRHWGVCDALLPHLPDSAVGYSVQHSSRLLSSCCSGRCWGFYLCKTFNRNTVSY